MNKVLRITDKTRFGHGSYFIIHNSRKTYGFTLIELLVVISIIGIIIGLSVFGLQGARQSSRDSKRKADLEQIRSGLEIYKSDCDKYPITVGSTLNGDDSNTSCKASNIYINAVPVDPTSPTSDYLYFSDGLTYELCAALEQSGNAEVCGGSSTCGATSCNYKVTNP